MKSLTPIVSRFDRVRLFVIPLVGCAICFCASEAWSQDYLRDVSRAPTTGGGSLSAEYDGFTEPKYDLLVAASEMGRIQSIEVKIGDHVKKGQLLAKLDDAMQHQAMIGAKIRAEMRGELEAAQAEEEVARLRVEQLRSLADQQMARPYEFKRAVADWEISKKQVLAAEEQIRLRKHEWERYELQYQRRKVLAPMDGVVAKIFHAPGEYVSPSDPSVVQLLVLNEIYAVFNVPFDELGGLKEGTDVSVHLSSLGKGVRGKVETLSPAIDGESGTIEVRVLIDNRDGRLRAGDRCQMIGVTPRSASRPQSPPQVPDGGNPVFQSRGKTR